MGDVRGVKYVVLYISCGISRFIGDLRCRLYMSLILMTCQIFVYGIFRLISYLLALVYRYKEKTFVLFYVFERRQESYLSTYLSPSLSLDSHLELLIPFYARFIICFL